MTNPALLLPAKARGYVYTALILLGLAVGAAQTAFDAIDESYPAWLLIAAKVVPYLTAGLGYAALTHTPKSDTVEYVGEHRETFVEPGAEAAARRDELAAVTILPDDTVQRGTP